MPFLRSGGETTNLTDVFNAYPERSALMLRLADHIMRGDSSFSVGERELIFAYVSGQNRCQFCYESHKPVAAAFGIDENLFLTLRDDIDAAPVDDRLKPVLRFVKKLTTTPHAMSQSDADAVHAAGWSDAALVDAVSVCAVANFFNRFVDGVGVDVSAETARETGAAVLPTIGYAGIADRLENE